MSSPSPLPVVEPFLPFPFLEGLLHPFSLNTFLEEYWEKRLLLVAETCSARDALCVPDWEAVARPAFDKDRRMVEVLSSPPTKDIQNFAQVQEAFAKGASVRIVNAQRTLEPLRELCAALSLELSHPVRANLYMTPPGRQGLDPHVDDHDVLVVQMSGRKGWKIFGAPYELPLEHRFPLFFEMSSLSRGRATWMGETWGARSFRGMDLGEPAFDGAIEVGELLYVPRGLLHVASSLDEVSVHATIGIHATRVGDLAMLAADRIARESLDLRRSLPLGFARYLGSIPEATAQIEAALRAVGPSGIRDALEEIGARHLASHRDVFDPDPGPANPVVGGEPEGGAPSMSQRAEPLPPVAVLLLDETRFRIFPDVQISSLGEVVTLRRFRRGVHQVDFPAAFGNAVIEIASHSEFGLSDIKSLSSRSLRTLLTHLVEKDLVEQLP